MLMLVVSLIGGGSLALTRMQIDIFPSLNLPQIYVVSNYGGMDPGQMEGLVTNVYELEFQYVARAIDIAHGAGLDKVGLMTAKVEAGQ